MSNWRLAELLLPWVAAGDWADICIASISIDTRQLTAGGLFIACENRVGDGRHYLAQACAKGAAAIVVSQFADAVARQTFTASLDGRIPIIEITNLAGIAAAIVARFYGDPSAQQHIIAITGTNGKTTCSYWLAQALTYLGKPCGVVGTLGVGADWRHLSPTGHTTPDAVTLQAQLAKWKQQGIQYVAIEASSHALDQGRLAGLHINQAVLTQVSRDHLDYHLTLQDYYAAKQRLFSWPNLKNQIVNADDVLGQQLWQQPVLGVSTWVYHATPDDLFNREDGCAHLAFGDMQARSGGYAAKLYWRLPQQSIQQYTILLPFPGRYNLANALAVIACLLAMGVTMQKIIEVIAHCQLPPGRMQSVANQRGLIIYVDFAHTPDALAMALDACREQTLGQLWVVFGAGGDRDAGKRPLMGKIAAEKANQVMLTADNPRSESAADIVAEILVGISTVNSVSPLFVNRQLFVHQQLDRRQALAQVLRAAKPGDVILVAGKGHEATQIIGDQILPFNDVQVIQELLQELAT